MDFRRAIMPHREVLMDIRECKASRPGHWYFTPEQHTEIFIDTSYLFQWSKNRDRYGKELYSAFSDLPVTAVVSPSRGMGSVIAHYIGARFGSKVRSMSAIRQNGSLSTINLMLSENDRVLAVDDGINTGNSMIQLLIDLERDFHCECVGVGVLIDRYTGILEKEFKDVPRVVTLFSGKDEFTPIVHRDECRACKRIEEIELQLESFGSVSPNEKLYKLVTEKTSLYLRSAYQD